MPTGSLVKFNADRGFGFIKADDAARSQGEVFVHISEMHRAGVRHPAIGNAFSYAVEVDPTTKKERATGLVRVW